MRCSLLLDFLSESECEFKNLKHDRLQLLAELLDVFIFRFYRRSKRARRVVRAHIAAANASAALRAIFLEAETATLNAVARPI